MLQQTLSATIAAFTATSTNPTIVFLALPPYQAPLLHRKAAWLAPFDAYSRYTSSHKSHHSSTLSKRSLDGKIVKRAPKSVPQPIVPTSSMCFVSSDAVNNATDSCSGRGMPVAGVSAKSGANECWVCGCYETVENGKTMKWGGEGCEKADLSSYVISFPFSSVSYCSVC